MKRLLVLVVAAGLLAGCASRVTGHPSQQTPSVRLESLPRGQEVFRIQTGGGMAPGAYLLAARPQVVVYADGTAFVPGPDTEQRGFPGHPFEFRKGYVPAHTLARLVADARDSHLLDGSADFGDPNIADAPGTTVTFRPDASAPRRTNVYALGLDHADGGLTTRQADNRARLTALLKRVEDGVVLNGRSGTTTWKPAHVDVTELRDGNELGAAVPWPGPPLDGVLRDHDHRSCGVLSGADAQRVWDAAVTHSTLWWREGDTPRQLIVRALLPGETGCEP